MRKFLFMLSILLFLSSHSFAGPQPKEFKFPSQTRMIQLSLTAGMMSSLDLHLAVDMSITPMKLKGKFQSLTDEGKVKESCWFSSRLTSVESQKIKAQLQKVRYCQTQGDENMIVDPEYLESVLVYTEVPAPGSPGRGADIKKYSLVGWGPQKYLCKGGKDLYQLMKSINEKRAPQSCPGQSAQLFEYRPDLNQ
jgi:hypothetical protein